MTKLLLLVEGPFGDMVASHLKAHGPVRVLPLVDSAPVFAEVIGDADFVSVASWRPYVAISEAIDRCCAAKAIAWSPAFLEGPTLVNGPVCAPWKGGACYQCYRRRVLTHRKPGSREDLIEAALEANPRGGVYGSTPIAAMLAALGILADAREQETAKGRIREIELLTGNVHEERVVPVHGCDRCGNAERRPERYTLDLARVLKGGNP